VSFGIGAMAGARAEVVQSLAKWKRMTLADLGFQVGEGIYTDMNAVRPDDAMDNLHSIYVDQWDWELVIDESHRTVDFLTQIVAKVYDVIRRTERYVCYEFDGLTPELPETITVVHAEDLARRFPDLPPKERELQVCREYGAVFVLGIRRELYFHRRLLAGELPLTIGGGIGQSRLAMLFLRKAHIGEIQASIWPDDQREACRRGGIPLL